MPAKILICDAVGSDHALVRRLHERLHVAVDGQDLIVHDQDTPSGALHAQGLRDAVGQSDLVIAIIAERDRLDAVEGKSAGWLRSPQSFLRIDLEEALKLSKPVLAILVGRAPLPPPKDLPRPLRSLATHPTVNLTQAGFNGGVDRIVRLVKQVLQASVVAPSAGAVLEIPPQGYGPHFVIDQDGVIKFAPPAALDRLGNNVDRLRRMHPALRDLSQGLVERLGLGNAPHNYLHERAKTYNVMISRALEEIDFSLLYIEGLRLANAEKAVAIDRELPPLDTSVRETVDSLLQLHGSFILASRDGLEAFEAEQRYRRNQQQEADYRSAAVDFASSLQGKPEIIDPAVATAALNAAREIDTGPNPERSGTVATGLLGNLTVAFSVAATIGTLSTVALSTGSPALVVIAAAAGLVATEGLKKSQPFVALTSFVSRGIDRIGRIELKPSLLKLGEQFKPQLELFRSVEKHLSKLASGREEIAWLGNAIRWVEEQMNAEPAASDNSSLSRLPEVSPSTLVGNIYLAKIDRVEPSLQCAFVEFGGAKHGFLAFDEIHPDYYQTSADKRKELADRLSHAARHPEVDQLEIRFGEVKGGGDRHRLAARAEPIGAGIQDLIKRRQVMLVQVTKDEIADEGAMLTTFLSIAGRFLVLTPNTAMELMVSKRIPSVEDRLRMAQLALEVPAGMGVFVRSSAKGIPDSEIIDEFDGLVRIWRAARDKTLRSQAPALIYDAPKRIVPPD